MQKFQISYLLSLAPKSSGLMVVAPWEELSGGSCILDNDESLLRSWRGGSGPSSSVIMISYVDEIDGLLSVSHLWIFFKTLYYLCLDAPIPTDR